MKKISKIMISKWGNFGNIRNNRKIIPIPKKIIKVADLKVVKFY
jgi:hypothetical protein